MDVAVAVVVPLSTVIVIASMDPVLALVDTETIKHVTEIASDYLVSVLVEILKAS